MSKKKMRRPAHGHFPNTPEMMTPAGPLMFGFICALIGLAITGILMLSALT